MLFKKLMRFLDSRYFFRIYAILAGVGGLYLAVHQSLWAYGWSIVLFRTPHLEHYFPGMFAPDGNLSSDYIREMATRDMAAAALFVLGWASAPLGFVRDRLLRGQSAGWFACGHGLVWFAIEEEFLNGLNQGAIKTWPAPGWVTGALLGVICIFLLFWIFPDADLKNPVGLRSFLTKGGDISGLRNSSYERSLLQAASEVERHRLAIELHDSVKQQLFAIQTAAATAQARFSIDAEGTAEALERVRAGARGAIAGMQAILDNPSAAPIEETGLVGAIREQCEAHRLRTGAQVGFDFSVILDPEKAQKHVESQAQVAFYDHEANRAARRPGGWQAIPFYVADIVFPIFCLFPVSLQYGSNTGPWQNLPPGSCDALLRVVQEALSNIARHARAQNVVIRLERRRADPPKDNWFARLVHGGNEDRHFQKMREVGDELSLVIHDDGCGFDPRQATIGMGGPNMRKRVEECGGKFALTSAPGDGTTVSVAFAYRQTPATPGFFFLGPWNGIHAAACVAMAGVFGPARWAFALLGMKFAYHFVDYLKTGKSFTPDLYSGWRTWRYCVWAIVMGALSLRYPWLYRSEPLNALWIGVAVFLVLAAVRNAIFFLHYRKTGYLQWFRANERGEYR